MNGYTLTCKLDPPPAAMDGAFFRPETLGAVSRESLAAMTMRCGRAAMRVGAVFEIEGEGGDRLALRQCPPLHQLGKAALGEHLVDQSPLLGAIATHAFGQGAKHVGQVPPHLALVDEPGEPTGAG